MRMFFVFYALLIVSFLPIFNYNNLLHVVKDMLANRANLFATGIITLILEIILVVAHNVWTLAWRIVITLLAWLTLIKGIMRLYFPEAVKN